MKSFHLRLAGLLLATAFLASTAPAAAVESAHFANEISDLSIVSDAVILGFVEKQEIGLSETTAHIRVLESYSGTLKKGESIVFKTKSGKVTVIQTQPNLTGVNRAIFYLSGNSENGYVSVKEAYGFKPVINDKVYTNPQNPLETVKLKKYQETLTATASMNPKPNKS